MRAEGQSVIAEDGRPFFLQVFLRIFTSVKKTAGVSRLYLSCINNNRLLQGDASFALGNHL